MDDGFVRNGELTDIRSFPAWAQDLASQCSEAREHVAVHPLFHLMREARLSPAQTGRFLTGVWPVIEQFPQYMALNLLKVQMGRVRGHDEARRYLIRNIRVEQNHADQWLDWALACGLSRGDLLYAHPPAETQALSHWCWHSCERDALAAGMAATNYAIEGVTGEWSHFVCARDDYENSFSPQVRAKAMKWLRLHAKYDDTHPWEALEIICMLVGTRPNARYFELIRDRVLTSYRYMRMALDACLDAKESIPSQRNDASTILPAERERA